MVWQPLGRRSPTATGLRPPPDLWPLQPAPASLAPWPRPWPRPVQPLGLGPWLRQVDRAGLWPPEAGGWVVVGWAFYIPTPFTFSTMNEFFDRVIADFKQRRAALAAEGMADVVPSGLVCVLYELDNLGIQAFYEKDTDEFSELIVSLSTEAPPGEPTIICTITPPRGECW